jgi:hypothetical protein
MITAALVGRAIDQWETEFGRSTIKNTVSALVLVLDETVRDGHHRSQPGQGPGPSPHGRPLFSQLGTERDLAPPNVAILEQLVARSPLGVIEGGRQCRLNARPTRSDGVDHLVGLGLVRRGLCCGRDDRSCSTASPSAAKRATQRCAHCRDTPTSLPYLADCDPLTGQLILA